jgi:amino acid adenylation domain-containing protein
MKNHSTPFTIPPPEEEAIQANGVHTLREIDEFPIEDVETSIPERFEKIVRLYPNQIAVKSDSDAVTYVELNAMANRLAHAIIAERGDRLEPIGMLLEKGVEQIAAMLGILKAGKFFILLDPSFPTDRLSLVLEDSQASLLLVDQRTLSLVQQDTPVRCKLMRIDTLAHSIPDEDPKIPISSHALASIVYTSGSTGRPKGVMRQHRALLHDAMLRVHTDGISKNDRLAHITAGTANSVTNSFYALLQGAALVTFDLKREGVACLANWLIDEKISVCLIASPVFRSLCTTLTGAERFPDLRYLRLRSDTVYSSDVALHRKYFPPTCVVTTGLASTEAGVLREYRIRHDAEFPGSEVPVGYALNGKEVLLLNEDGKEVEFNEIGEIVVRSEYLSSGYWNDPELTAEKFRPDPNDSEKRLYHTGDLGLMLPDGCLIHKGRKDFRVKIRGYGVDLVEVEKALRSHGNIKDAVVIAKPGASGDARLIAYYASERQPGATADELRKFLGANLADYMVPSTFVKLDALPLTSNGKVNRNALPEPSNERPDLKESYQSPRNATEQALVEIWEGLLDVRPVGVHDNFFDLGGHSLTATRLVSEVTRHFEWELPLQQLFQCPTVAEIAPAIDQHRGQKFKNDNLVQLPAVSTKPVSRDYHLPLAYSQQGLWFLDQLHPGSFTYNLFSAYQLKGSLNISALEKSFNEIIRRHEILRTVFESVEGRPHQVTLPSLAIEIPVIDLRGIASEEDRLTEIRRVSRYEAQRPFDLARGPLLRIKLLRLAQNQYVLLRAIDHIIFDAWSSSVMHSELAQLYRAFSKGEPSPLADLSIQYANYAVWQRQCLEAGALQSQLSYWKKQLSNLPALPLPTDKPRPAINKSHGARQYYKLSKDLCEDLRALSRRYGVTLFTIMLAAFQTLISRHSGQTDIVVGSPFAGRNRSEFDESIGYFLNMVVLRADLSGNPTFAEVISRVWKVCLEALSHQDLPFQKLVEELHPERDLSHHPLMQVAFPFQSTRLIPPQLSGLEVNELEVETGIARCDLQLEVEDHGDFLKGFIDYNVDLFNADTIDRLLEHFRILLAGIVANPDRRICDYPLLTEPERQKLLVEWNTTTQYFQDKCIHELFEDQVEKSPDSIAVVFEDQQVTYRELNIQANQLAHYLRKLGVGAETLVGVCVERSIDMIVGLLGILKAGGAYVPLDPTYPKEWLEFMVDDCKASVMVTQKRLAALLPIQKLRVAYLDEEDWKIISPDHLHKKNLANGKGPDSLAYVIYTSGSTGQPKGTLITHYNVARLFQATERWFRFNSRDIWTQFHSYAFDFSAWEIWGALLYGGRLVIVPREISRSPQEFVALLLQQRVTILNQTPSAFYQLIPYLTGSASRDHMGLRYVIFGGEALALQNLKPWCECYGDEKPKLINMYGITETTVHVTYRRITRADLVSATGSAIGKPIPDLRVYLLDRHKALVPIGVAGEIHVGGAGVAKGYLGRDELTTHRFVADTFGNDPQAKLYCSGDLARWLPDGDLEYLGRIDDQVKIRGYRIELREIEAVLGQHPTVRETVVLAREDSPGDKRLVAYVVTSGVQVEINALRYFLKQKLPDYMVPSAFVFLDALPLTPNGKVDRQALPGPDQSRPDLENAFVAPRTAVEKVLAKIWGDILKLERVGIYDNFFELGGHSLLATQVMSRINQALRVESPLRSLFETPTIAGWVMTMVQDSDQLARTERRAQIFLKVNQLSDDQVEEMLNEKRSASPQRIII